MKVGYKITNIRDVFSNSKVFATSFKSIAKIMVFDWWSGFITIKLPSGQLKLFFYFSKAEFSIFNYLGYDFNKSFRSEWKLNWSKAGLYSNLGRKPKVRGVAKNPVDHPHGGRTKSIKFQRTPWGLPTKKK
jgi:large subunit ribosomal protein L2